MISPLDFAERIANGEAPDAAILAWLAGGLRRWQRGEPLERGLGLTGSNRVRTRNRSLIAAAEALRTDPALSAWELSGKLADCLQRFEAGKLIRYRRGLAVTLDEVERCLLDAIQSGARPLNSRRRIYELLKTD